MIKILGLVMIVTSCSMMGLSMAREMEQRKAALKNHISALQLIRSEICYKNTPLEEILFQLEQSCGKAAATFYRKSFEAASNGLAFSAAAEQYYIDLKKDGLLAEDIEVIRNICRILGRYDSATQAEHLAAAAELLEKQLDNLQKELSSKGRLYKTVGATAGILLALIVV